MWTVVAIIILWLILRGDVEAEPVIFPLNIIAWLFGRDD